MRLFRLLRIGFVGWKYSLDELVLERMRNPYATTFLNLTRFGRNPTKSRGVRLREALEELGPIFIKFGQVLSTRRDIVPQDIADELQLLQDRVPPFPSKEAVSIIESTFGKSVDELFATFNKEPCASASVAQVHEATLHNGRRVAVKILRPEMQKVIEKDLLLLHSFAGFIQRFVPDGKRLKPKEVIAEFDQYLHDELDLQIEAANCSQLRRNFKKKGRENLLLIPEVHWDYSNSKVFTMDWMEGIPIAQIDSVIEAGVDIKKLARMGVEIFFMQVFEDGFFHADMHPGNIFISVNPQSFGQYVALDFGIVGSLSDFDKNYLAQNFLAFFQRDYRRVAQLHIESQWVPPNTREEQLEAAIRTVCEPYFDRPISEISLGNVLKRLFQISKRFHVSIQPQLVLLQKTLLNVEGMGRELDPDLDLWSTAKPFLERWMINRVGPKRFVEQLKHESSQWADMLPQIPRLVYQNLERQDRTKDLLEKIDKLNEQQDLNSKSIIFVLILMLIMFILFIIY